MGDEEGAIVLLAAKCSTEKRSCMLNCVDVITFAAKSAVNTCQVGTTFLNVNMCPEQHGPIHNKWGQEIVLRPSYNCMSDIACRAVRHTPITSATLAAELHDLLLGSCQVAQVCIDDHFLHRSRNH